ncbi:benzoate 4-monooxygenase cytochrome P450 [Aaosphaeria arxii CBS 175.79]|uniref:Benzoate 4-monooxygenase cytochrome P450 n=1 Tax=Aaosphaeria arxii CBS 175.79 TaxID=1450172 RepID=A0A6A5YB15_9PLEO|nr:benzoate 4-monooxygenase cytochrome P450 [Aaosphaeria arxii CBS 175.79]KAF2022426.1 benzoate 4-monooxygenase cytochrome P450 [Aaosphaeria arxii CBS 175.79]
MALTLMLLGVAVPLYVVLRAVYNVFFHPLAEIPGPFLARVSSWLSFYHAYKGDRHLWITRCFEIYGSRVRLTPDTVLFRSARASNDIYGHGANLKKSNFYDSWPKNKHDFNTLSTTDPALHLKKRKLLKLAVNEWTAEAAAGIIAKHIDRWNELTTDNCDDGAWSDGKDMKAWADALLFDIFGDLLLGRSFETKEKTTNNPFREIPSHVIKFMQFIYPVTKSPFLDVIVWLKPRGLNALLERFAPREVQHYYDFVASSVAQGLEASKSASTSSSTPREDIFHFLCTSIDPESGKPAFTEEELLSETHLLNIAGRDTTVCTISALFHYLSQNRAVYDKVAQEVRETFTEPEEVLPGARLNSCAYVRACIWETLRLAPPGPSELPRVILKGGMTIDGEFYPEGTIVGTAGWANGHNDGVYGDAEVFRPERWIVSVETGVTAEEVARLKEGFHPFLKGPGGCLGQHLALMELNMILGRTLLRMDFEGMEASGIGDERVGKEWGRWKGQYQLDDAYMAIGKGPMVRFRKRGNI